MNSGGEGGIRTHGGFAPTPDFESGTFDHSATSPVRAIGGTIAGTAALRYCVAPYLGQAHNSSRIGEILSWRLITGPIRGYQLPTLKYLTSAQGWASR